MKLLKQLELSSELKLNLATLVPTYMWYLHLLQINSFN